MRAAAHLAAGLLLSTACEGATLVPPDAGAADALADAAITGPDRLDPADAATLEDADAPDARPSRLAFRPLLAGSPVDNRIFDLALDPTSGHWAIPTGDGSDTFTRLVRESRPRTPGDGPILRVTAEVRTISALVTDALADGDAIDVTLWLGRHVDLGGQLPIVSLLGVDEAGREIAADVAPDPELRALDAIEWACYRGRWSAGALGVITVSIVDGEEGLDMYLTGLAVTRAPQDHPRSPPRVARARALTPQDRHAQAALRGLRAPRPVVHLTRPER